MATPHSLRQRSEDLEHLRILTICHYVIGGLAGLAGCLPIIHLVVGIALLSGAFDQPGGQRPPEFMGVLFVALAVTFIIAGWSYAVSMIIAGRCLRRRRAYTFCIIMAAISLMFTPFGTVLGVFTLIVLLRPSVKELFGKLPEDDTLNADFAD